MNAVLIKDEAARLQALQQYEVLDTPADPALDDITRLLAQICGVPIAAISLVDANRVWFKSRVGTDVRELPRAGTPFQATLEAEDLLEIPDIQLDRLYSRKGVRLGQASIRFYAGAPLATPDGTPIGSLCVMDTEPRALDESQLAALRILSRQVITRMELHAKVRAMERSARARARIESALTVERNFVSAVLDTVGALVIVFDTAGRVVRFNRTCETISGYSFTELVGRPYWERLVPQEEIPEEQRNFESIRAGGFPVEYENRWLTRHGSLSRIAWSATALLDAQNEVAFVIATGIDVTEQREAEETLRESEARYRQLVEGSLGMVCTHDLDGNLLSINTNAALSLGYEVEELIGVSLADLIPQEFRYGLPKYLGRICDEGEAQGTLHLNHRDGSQRVIAYRNKLIELPGRDAYVLGHGIDITEKMQAEEKLRMLIRQSNSILESVGDGIFGIDLEGNATVINPAAAQMLGYEPQELLGKSMHHLTHHTRADGTPFPVEDCPIRKSVAAMKTIRVTDDVFWHKDGTSFPVEYVACPQVDDGHPVGVVVAFTDVTERRQLDRMKDEFISTVSHELRTPLTSLRAALGLVAGGALNSRPDKMGKMLEIAIGNTERLVRLVNDILDLERIGSGKIELHYTMCNAEDLLHRSADLQQTSAAKADIHFIYDIEPVNVWADPDRILQTITNLISNAIKFSPPGSTIRLATRALPNNEACIEVHDEGRGIPRDKLEMIFERFQQVDASDSRAMGGTGLGLAICRSIVQQHGGRIWAASDPGKGSSFYFSLPTRPSTSLR
ncbi:MAG: PAS domain S-box protein [Acidobacteriaceae bacterium]